MKWYIIFSTDSQTYWGAGIVHVYTTDGTNVTSLRTLHSPNPQYSGGFGCSLGINNMLITVGAYMETVTTGPDWYFSAGHAYVFTSPESYSRL